LLRNSSLAPQNVDNSDWHLWSLTQFDRRNWRPLSRKDEMGPFVRRP